MKNLVKLSMAFVFIICLQASVQGQEKCSTGAIGNDGQEHSCSGDKKCKSKDFKYIKCDGKKIKI